MNVANDMLLQVTVAFCMHLGYILASITSMGGVYDVAYAVAMQNLEKPLWWTLQNLMMIIQLSPSQSPADIQNAKFAIQHEYHAAPLRHTLGYQAPFFKLNMHACPFCAMDMYSCTLIWLAKPHLHASFSRCRRASYDIDHKIKDKLL